MALFEVIIGLIVCIAGAGFFYILARRKKQKRFIFFAALFSLAVILFAIYLALAAVFLTSDSFDRSDSEIPGQDWRTRRGYESAGKISEGQNPIGLLYFLYDNNQLGFHLDSEARTSVLKVDLSAADDPALSLKNMKLEDLNFDGFKDIRIPVKYTDGNVIYKCYLWDKKQAAFEYSPELSALPGIEVDAAAKIIKSITYINYEKPAEKNYRWQNEKLTIIIQ